jgi:hypothetical protein
MQMTRQLRLTGHTALVLPRSAYRATRPSPWRLALQCVRHPIIALAAWRQQEHPPAFSQRTKTLVWIALLHGAIAALLT